jgi:hypothetical protein
VDVIGKRRTLMVMASHTQIGELALLCGVARPPPGRMWESSAICHQPPAIATLTQPPSTPVDLQTRGRLPTTLVDLDLKSRQESR